MLLKISQSEFIVLYDNYLKHCRFFDQQFWRCSKESDFPKYFFFFLLSICCGLRNKVLLCFRNRFPVRLSLFLFLMENIYTVKGVFERNGKPSLTDSCVIFIDTVS